MTSEQAEQAEELAEDLRLAVARLVRQTRAQADELPRGRAETLARLETAGAQTIAQLAEHRGVRHQAMSRSIAELGELGLVRRMPSPTDARASLILLSVAGAQALEEDRQARRDVLATAIAALEPDELAVLRQVPALFAKLTSSGPPRTPPGPHRSRA